MEDKGDLPSYKNKKAKKKENNYAWPIKVFFISLMTTAVLTLMTDTSMDSMSALAALVLLVLFISINILFDTVGLAVATAAESPFHSMASKKHKVGKTAVRLLKNADKVSSVCNDIVGDIAGVVSGATSVAIADKLFMGHPAQFWLTLAMTSLVAAFTVGGKAVAKRLAIEKSIEIVILASKVISLVTRNKDKKRSNKKK